MRAALQAASFCVAVCSWRFRRFVGVLRRYATGARAPGSLVGDAFFGEQEGRER